MNDLVHEGVTSFKLFMAYPGVFMLDDGSIFKALQTLRRTAGWFACTPKTAARLTSSCSRLWRKASGRRSIYALTRPQPRRPRPSGAAIGWRDGGRAHLHRPLELATMRWRKFARPGDRGLPVLRRNLPAVLYLPRNMDAPVSGSEICFSLPRCGKSGTRKNSGTASSTIICKCLHPIIARSVSKNRKKMGATISRRSPTAVRAWSTA